MDSCCENKAGELAQLRAQQSRVLYWVLAINALMFLFEFASGLLLGSTALLGDSLDMLGDASVYALTLFVLHRGARARAGAALVKGGFMLLFGLVVIADAAHKLYVGTVPDAGWMGLIGLLALIANGICFALLYTHRSDDLNMRSTWLCSRNDLVANSCVIIAAGLVALTGSFWPDVIVGMAIAALFLHSAAQVIRAALQAWRAAAEEPDTPGQGQAHVIATAQACCPAVPPNPASSLLTIAEPSACQADSACCSGPDEPPAHGGKS